MPSRHRECCRCLILEVRDGVGGKGDEASVYRRQFLLILVYSLINSVQTAAGAFASPADSLGT